MKINVDKFSGKDFEYLDEIKKLVTKIDEHINLLCNSLIEESPNELKDLFKFFKDYALRPGKRIRPILLILTYKGYGGKDEKEALKLGAVVEIMHSFLLVHDDIIDNSVLRRGEPTLHKVYESIFNSPKEAVIGFLQGLFSADGTIRCDVKNGNYYIRLSSKSKRLLEQVQLLLLNLGIKSRIYERHRERRVTFQYKTIKGELRLYEDIGLFYELHISKNMIPVFLQKIGFLCNKHDKKIEKLKKVKFQKTKFTDRIISKEPVGFTEVYDIIEPETHSFIANGIVVHNCGEQPLYPYDSCNLGSIDVSKMVVTKKGKSEIDWDKLRKVVRNSVRFLDNVIDASQFPLKEIEQRTKRIRRIGLGIMGFADMLIKLGVPYNSDEALKLAEELMKFITEEGRKMSVELAKEKGSFPEFENSIWKKRGYKAMRNSTITTIAPTSNLSIIAGCSHSIEPLFSITYVRNVQSSLGTNLIETNPLFEKIAKERGFFSEDLMKKVLEEGSIQHIKEIPEDVRRIFVVAHDITPEWHVKIQAAFQKYTDNAVSKTVNFPHNATVEDIKKVYMLAYKLGCKGITVYRDGSRQFQIINMPKSASKTKSNEKVMDGNGEKIIEEIMDSTGACPTCHL
ncbi:MAG: polyprenyl synthetase family protein [Fervidobacterium sp.]